MNGKEGIIQDWKRMKTAGELKQLTMIELLERHVKERPEAAALYSEPQNCITFSKLWEASGRVYHWLKQNGIGAEDIVMYCLPRGTDLYIAAIGTMRAGAAFVLTETDNNSKRTAFIRTDCRCRLYVEEEDWNEIMACEALEGYEHVSDHSLCYIAYTSGTTGTPKGVLQEYGSMENAWKSARINGKPLVGIEDTFLLMSPMNFVSLPIVLSFSCVYGNAVAIMPYACAENKERFLAYQRETHVNCGYATPSFLRKHPAWIEGWRMCILSSEPADGLFLSGIRCFNAYASTESGCLLAVYELTEAVTPAPVGKAQSDVQVFVKKEYGQEAKAGETGELCFRNPYVRGYLNRPKATRHLLRDGVLHTGDLGRMDAEGNLIVTGRIGEMFKIDGYRIEPEEIEAAVRKVSELRNLAVRGFVYKDISSILVFYTDDVTVDPVSMKEKLGDLIPEYMIPTGYIHLEQFPMLETGKLDRQRLLPPEGSWDNLRKCPETDLKEIGRGKTAVVYSFGEGKVLKLFNPTIQFPLITKELTLTRETHKLGIPSPDAYEIVRSGAGYGIVFDFAEGTELEEAIKEHPEHRNEWMDRFTKAVKKIHSIEVNGDFFPDLHAKSLSLSDELTTTICSKAEAKKIRSIFERLPVRHTYIHGDCHPGNAMVKESEIRFIDFTLCGAGHPVFDHLCMYSHLVFLPSFQSEEKCVKKFGMNRKEAEALFDRYLSLYYGLHDDESLAEVKRIIIGVHGARLTHASIVLPGVFTDDMLKTAKERALRFAEAWEGDIAL